MENINVRKNEIPLVLHNNNNNEYKSVYILYSINSWSSDT